MIKLFRKIRQNLLSEGKTGKYFKYAIGEIVLVVIGILIALQINNWNESKKLEVTKKSYYKQLLTDLDKESVNIKDYLSSTENSIKTYQEYLEKFKEPNLTTENLLNQLNEVEFTFPIIRFNTNTIETLKSTGEIKLIPTDISNNLIEIQRTQETIKDAQFLNDAEYVKVLTSARQLGFSTINTMLANQPELSELLDIDENSREIILILDSAFRLKNFTERNRINFFNELLTMIEDTKSKIKKKMK